MDTILNQPNRRRVSTDWLNRVDSQQLPFLEGESYPTHTCMPERPSHTHAPKKTGFGLKKRTVNIFVYSTGPLIRNTYFEQGLNLIAPADASAIS